MGTMSIWHWLVVLLVIVLLFGAKKIPELAKGLGSGIRTFKKEIESDDEKKPQPEENVTQTHVKKEEGKPEIIEAQVIESKSKIADTNYTQKSEKV
ncbi:twin-arginine translocase TatA/TatE family subunit [Helicobacter aurati]|uniref:Sec-independent protein translocase protein TatA n=1 Tax=Helicobacter aurati TaxID=137778 RepID=A0A3D8J1B7_9HELI|nr:twin-arginine translocase TatA/TatE family subunit [Helicobacter aurati]RDU71006.1 twin-arginine translocase TatA/TatE family subunit [Helicobacter aurati]